VAYYERLSAQDASFLAYEDADPTAHMHIGGVSVYEGGGLTNARGGVDIERLRAYVASRLALIPRYRQRLATTPLVEQPVWVDDERFDVRYHVRHTRLPRPGDDRELKRLAGRILSQRLDRNRPLWELWVIEGLTDRRFAMLTKTHHCMMDGVSGVDVSSVLMRLEADPTFEPATPWTPRPAPTGTALLTDEIARRARIPLQVVRGLTGVVRAAWTGRGHLQQSLGSAGEMVRLAWQGAAATPINRPIGPHRRFDWTVVPLADAKAIKNRLGGKLNDVVLAVVAGALGAFLRRRRVNVDILDFIAAIPVNVRAGGDTSLGNHVAAWLARLPIAEGDAKARFEHVVTLTTTLKRSGSAAPTAGLYELAEIGGRPALTAVVELTRRLSPCNLVVTNVPGPSFPLYMLDAKMLLACPQVTLLAEQGLGIAIFSYLGNLHFGFNADWDLIPDLHDLVSDVEAAFGDLAAVAGVDRTTAGAGQPLQRLEV
jgi:WS/DGAT/MGAT family acyltransferase